MFLSSAGPSFAEPVLLLEAAQRPPAAGRNGSDEAAAARPRVSLRLQVANPLVAGNCLYPDEMPESRGDKNVVMKRRAQRSKRSTVVETKLPLSGSLGG